MCASSNHLSVPHVLGLSSEDPFVLSKSPASHKGRTEQEQVRAFGLSAESRLEYSKTLLTRFRLFP